MKDPYTNISTVRLLTFKEVQNISGLSRSTIYRQMKVGAFPKALLLSQRKVGFLSCDLQEWINSRRLPQ